MIFLFCALTVVIEVVFLALLGIRKRDEIIIVICANIITNLTLNIILGVLLKDPGLYLLLLLEAAVVILEFLIYRIEKIDTNFLFGKTLLANVTSFLIGIMLFPWR